MSWLRERARAARLLTLWLSVACGGGSRSGVPAAPGGPSDDRDAASTPDAGKPVVPVGPIAYEVPGGGGATTVMAADGSLVVFDFPASAAGAQIMLTPVAASSIGWPADQFAQVIRMEPDGMRFEHPVLVRPVSGDAIVLAFATAQAKGPAQGLPLNLAGDGFLLAHFSTLVVVPPASSCDRHSGWVVSDGTTSGKRCTERKSPSYITFSCSAAAYCLEIEAQCCADLKASACHLGDPQLSVSFKAAPVDERYPYCRAPSEAGHGGDTPGPSAGAGGATGSSGGGGPEAGSGGGAGSVAAESGGAGGEAEVGGAGAGGEAEAGSGGVAGEAEAGSGGVTGEAEAGSGGLAGEAEAGSGGGGGEAEAGAGGAGGEAAEGGGGDGGDAEVGSGGTGGEAEWPGDEAGAGAGGSGDQGA